MSNFRRHQRAIATLIEPDEFARNVLSEVQADIRALFGLNSQKVSHAVLQFSRDTDCDIFTPLKTSPHTNVRSTGYRLHLESTNRAIDLARVIDGAFQECLRGSEKPIDRKKILTKFMLTREELGKNFSAFEALGETEKALRHLDSFMKYFSSLVRLHLGTFTHNLTSEKVVGIGMKVEEVDPAMTKVREEDRFIYDIYGHPQLIGIAYAQFEINNIFLKKALSLQGHGPESIRSILEKQKVSRMAAFATPEFPDIDDPRIKAGIRAMLTLGPEPGRKFN